MHYNTEQAYRIYGRPHLTSFDINFAKLSSRESELNLPDTLGNILMIPVQQNSKYAC